jgi:O-antigen/teichoic acid export membrane protein
MRKLLYINSFSGAAQAIISTLLIFFTIPIFIHKLGSELYGVFSLLALIGNLNVFINLGLNSSLIKFLAEQNKCQESNFDIVVSFLVLLFIAIPITIIGIVYHAFILRHFLSVPLHYINADLVTLYICLLFSNLLQFLGQVPSSVIDSQQKIYISNILQMCYNYAYWAFLLVSLFFFPTLRIIGFSILFVNMLWFISITIIAKNVWGPLSVDGLRPNVVRIAKKQISYGSKIFASGIISFFYEPITKILLSRFVGINEVGFFDIALKMRNQIWNMLSKLIYPFFPLLSKMNDLNKIRIMLHDLEQKIAYITIPLIAGIMFLSHPFVSLWLGKNIEIISTSFIFIVAGYLIGIIVQPTYLFLMAKGHPEKTINLQLINVSVNGLLFFISYKHLGYYAAIVGNTGAILASFAGCLYYQSKYLDIFLFDSITQVFKLFTLIAAICVTGFLLNVFISANMVKLFIFPASFFIVTLLSFRFLHIFSKDDLDRYLGKSVNRGKTILSKILISG